MLGAMTRRLQIGEFARLTTIPVKTLRYYAEEGLLAPDHVDPQTAYRYYAADQVPAATRILNLRLAGLSVHDIRALEQAHAVDEAAWDAALTAQRRRLEGERARIEAQIGAIDLLRDALQTMGPAALTAIRFRIAEPDHAFVLTQSAEEHAPSLTELFEEAEQRVAKAAARADKAPYTIFNHDPAAPARAFVCIPVRDDALDRLETQLVGEAALTVSATFCGPYEQAAKARRAIAKFLHSAGARPPLRECAIYHRFGASEVGYALPKRMLARSRDEFVTEIRTPVKFEGG